MDDIFEFQKKIILDRSHKKFSLINEEFNLLLELLLILFNYYYLILKFFKVKSILSSFKLILAIIRIWYIIKKRSKQFLFKIS